MEVAAAAIVLVLHSQSSRPTENAREAVADTRRDQSSATAEGPAVVPGAAEMRKGLGVKL